MLFANKINKFRTFALLFIFLGFGAMYLGFLWPSLHTLFFILGLIVILGGVGIYFLDRGPFHASRPNRVPQVRKNHQNPR